MPLTGMQEELSFAYLHMLTSATGLDIATTRKDYDVRDVAVRSTVDYGEIIDGGVSDSGIDIQLKSTGREQSVQANSVAWSVSARTLKKLRTTNRTTPRMLCVLVAPSDATFWLHSDPDGLLARSHMYYEWGHHLPALVPGQQSQTVHLPLQNLLTPGSLIDLMEEASTWRPRP